MNLTNLSNKDILSNESELVKFLEMDSYYQLIESGEIKTDSDKIECIRNSINLYLESSKTHVVYIGEFTFVEPHQNDYEELYFEYNIDSLDNVQSEPQFCIVHEVFKTAIYSEKLMDEIEKNGDSYLIPDKYNGIIIWKNKP